MAQSKIETFMNPSGFIEQHYIGRQTADSVTASANTLKKLVKTLRAQSQPALILLDISRLKIVFDKKAHAAAIKGLRAVKYDRGAIYGPVSAQVLLNTLSMVAGVQHKVRAFNGRADAVQWLKAGN